MSVHGGQDSNRAIGEEEETLVKRRKVRKGTQSCWECKRRKIRCIYASSDDVTCISCQRRNTPCVSQDLPEDLSPARLGNRHIGDRIARVEDLLENLLATRKSGARDQEERQLQQDEQSFTNGVKARSKDSAPSRIGAPPTPAESPAESLLDPSCRIPDLQGVSGQAETETTTHHLLAAFPCKQDAMILLRESSRPSLFTHAVNTQPHSRLTPETLSAPRSIPALPSPNAHPVILAKCMLIFAITLQSPCGQAVLGLSEPQSVLMRRLMAAATTWVTTQEEMHGTIESLICIILEGVFEINCGNLRRAWFVFRRAMNVAQLMGLHRSPMPPLHRIEPEVDGEPEFMWFRIIYMDRYLSLLLGLPQGTSDRSMADTSVLRDEPPLGKFERLLTVMASRILERNEGANAISEASTTQSIDSELLRTSQSMPASFWRPANFHQLKPGSSDTLLETVRLAAHVYYYGLLIQLHLPYVLRADSNSEHEYSRITCLNASREIMTRFIAHRSFNPTSSCSRPVDFYALLAAMTLLLAHLDAHQHQQATNLLAHQRLSDRIILDQALERMDVISNMNKDLMTEKSASLVRRLLKIEADAAEGSKYTATNVEGDHDVRGEKKGGEVLHIQIPYLGVIRIAREGPISRETGFGDGPSRPLTTYSNLNTPQKESLATSANTLASPHPSSSAMEEQCRSSGHGIGQDPTVWQDLPPISERPNAPFQGPGLDQSTLQYPSAGHDEILGQSDMDLPSIAAGVDDWTFQGVDAAYFDTLMRGTWGEDAVGLEQQWVDN